MSSHCTYGAFFIIPGIVFVLLPIDSFFSWQTFVPGEFCLQTSELGFNMVAFAVVAQAKLSDIQERTGQVDDIHMPHTLLQYGYCFLCVISLICAGTSSLSCTNFDGWTRRKAKAASNRSFNAHWHTETNWRFFSSLILFSYHSISGISFGHSRLPEGTIQGYPAGSTPSHRHRQFPLGLQARSNWVPFKFAAQESGFTYLDKK